MNRWGARRSTSRCVIPAEMASSRVKTGGSRSSVNVSMLRPLCEFPPKCHKPPHLWITSHLSTNLIVPTGSVRGGVTKLLHSHNRVCGHTREIGILPHIRLQIKTKVVRRRRDDGDEATRDGDRRGDGRDGTGDGGR